MMSLMIAPEPPAPSFWNELRDGSAGVGSRIAVNIALLIALMGLCPIAAFVLAAIVPNWGRGYGRYIYPSDELMATTIIFGVGFLIVATTWLWTPKGRWRQVIKPILYTVGIIFTTTILCVVSISNRFGDDEILVFGLIMLGAASIILVWIPPIYRLARGRPAHNQGDGLLNVHCPTCNYRMVGLHESRCPECGTSYTLDELLSKQNFSHGRQQESKQQPLPPPLRVS
jgi:hypothetical protein